MKILFIVPWYLTPDQPHSGTFFRDLGEGLVDKGHEVQVMYPRVGAGFRAFITGNYDFPEDKSGKVPVTYSFIPNIIPRVERLRPWLLMYKCVRDTKKLFKRWGKPDLIHAHSVYRAGFIARQLSRWYDIPYIISENFTVVGLGVKNNIWTLTNYSRIFQGASQIITVSSSLRETLHELYSIDLDKTEVVHNIVNEVFYNTYTPITRTTPFKLHYIAFLRKKKQPELLIRAIEVLTSNNIDVSVTISGDGSIRPKLEQLAEELQVDHRIHFLGYMSRMEIKQYIDRSHAVISTSYYETFGVNLIEGLASGRPVIATDSLGPRDFIHEDNGILVEEHSPNAVAEAIIMMIDHYSDYDQEEIRQEAVDRFSTKRIVSELEKIYKKIEV